MNDVALDAHAAALLSQDTPRGSFGDGLDPRQRPASTAACASAIARRGVFR
ncbi:MAG: hypothetical protein KGQ61_05990 [Planctomycetes bacterium]|nr:hypothetical protein [Planctomycetota bacterium]